MSEAYAQRRSQSLALPPKTCNGPTRSPPAFEGTDIQALLDHCDSIQGQWHQDRDTVIAEELPRSAAPPTIHKSSHGRRICIEGTSNKISKDSAKGTFNNGTRDVVGLKNMDDDLFIVDFVTEEGKEMEEALHEMRTALAEAKALRTQEDADKTAAPPDRFPMAVASQSCANPLPEQSPIFDVQRQKFQAKLRELALDSIHDHECELSDRALLEMACGRLLEDKVPNPRHAVGGAPRSFGNDIERNGNRLMRSGTMLSRNSAETQLLSSSSFGSIPGSHPDSSGQTFRSSHHPSHRDGASSFSVESASRSIASDDPAIACKGSQQASSITHESCENCPNIDSLDSFTKTEEHLIACHFDESSSQMHVKKKTEFQKGNSETQEKEAITESDLGMAQRVASHTRIHSEKLYGASAVIDKSSSVKGTRHRQQQESSNKVYKPEKSEIQELRDCACWERTQSTSVYRTTATKSVSLNAATASQKSCKDCNGSGAGLTKLPRLHTSKSSPALPVKQQVGEGHLRLPQITRTRSWLGLGDS